jgi:hypothetical protein
MGNILGIISWWLSLLCYFDATRKTWVYFIRQKSNVFDTFKKWKDLVENETGKSLKCLRSDNGGEYYKKEFDDYCSYHGIHREKTVP